MKDLEDLQKIVVKFRDDRDWAQFHNPKDMALSLVLESTEFMEHFQWKNSEEMTSVIANKKVELSDELADVLYWVLLIANDVGINLDAALKAKILKNDAKYPVSKAKGKHTKYTEL